MIRVTRFSAAELFMILNIWISVCVTVLSGGHPDTAVRCCPGLPHCPLVLKSCFRPLDSYVAFLQSQSPRSLKHKSQEVECMARAL